MSVNNISEVVLCLLFQLALLVIVLMLCRRVEVVIELFYEAAKCLTSVPMLLVQPLWMILIRIIFISYWIVVYACIVTLGLLSVMFFTTFFMHLSFRCFATVGSVTGRASSVNQPFTKVYFSGPGLTWSNCRKVDRLNRNLR